MLTLSALITDITAASGLPGASSQIRSAPQVTSLSTDCQLLPLHVHLCVLCISIFMLTAARNQRLTVWHVATVSDIFNSLFFHCLVLKEPLA